MSGSDLDGGVSVDLSPSPAIALPVPEERSGGVPTLRVGTRASRLALAQADLVVRGLAALGIPSRVVHVETEGDRRTPDTPWGEGAFVKAIERALLDDRVDIAVHSAKDVPTDEDPRLVIAAFLPREDPRDALVLRAGSAGGVADLPHRARVGTDSPRRTGFLLAHRPDLQLHPLHGNVDTRLRRLDGGESDALVLAVAGLTRLGMAHRVSEALDPSVVPPAPGQGAIAVQVRADDAGARGSVERLDDRPTREAVELERAFLAASGGGCRSPIGALAEVRGEMVTLVGGHARPDGSMAVVEAVHGAPDEVAERATALARRLRDHVRAEDATAPSEAKAAPAPSTRPRVLVTRPASQAAALIEALAQLGVQSVLVPAIETEPLPTAPVRDDLAAVGPDGWAVVTSVNGARAAVEASRGVAAPPRWAAIGAGTAAVMEEAGLVVAHRPRHADARSLAIDLPAAPGERVLLIRGDLADERLPEALRARGLVVREVVAYRTLEAPVASRPLLAQALRDRVPDAVVFASPSAVRGLLALAAPHEHAAIRAMPAICIGRETGGAAAEHGFRVLAHAPMQSADGLARATAEALLRADASTPTPSPTSSRTSSPIPSFPSPTSPEPA